MEGAALPVFGFGSDATETRGNTARCDEDRTVLALLRITAGFEVAPCDAGKGEGFGEALTADAPFALEGVATDCFSTVGWITVAALAVGCGTLCLRGGEDFGGVNLFTGGGETGFSKVDLG